MATKLSDSTTSISSTEALVLSSTTTNEFGAFVNFNNMTAADEFVVRVAITAKTGVTSNYKYETITWKKIKQGNAPLYYLAPTPGDGILIYIKKTKGTGTTSIFSQLLGFP